MPLSSPPKLTVIFPVLVVLVGVTVVVVVFGVRLVVQVVVSDDGLVGSGMVVVGLGKVEVELVEL